MTSSCHGNTVTLHNPNRSYWSQFSVEDSVSKPNKTVAGPQWAKLPGPLPRSRPLAEPNPGRRARRQPTCSAPTQGPSLACVLLRISSRKSGLGGRTRELPCRATACSDTGSPPFRSDALWDFPSDPVRKVRKRRLEAECGHSG